MVVVPLNTSTTFRQVTSRWTTFGGKCLQYKFLLNAETTFKKELPWKLIENSKFCVKGVLTDTGQIAIVLFSDDTESDAHVLVSFR